MTASTSTVCPSRVAAAESTTVAWKTGRTPSPGTGRARSRTSWSVARPGTVSLVQSVSFAARSVTIAPTFAPEIGRPAEAAAFSHASVGVSSAFAGVPVTLDSEEET